MEAILQQPFVYSLLNDEIISSIKHNIALAIIDAILKDRIMGGFWIIISFTRSAEIKNKMCSKQWSKNANKGAEAIVLLDLIQIINKKSRHIDSGSIKICTDNQKKHK